MTRNSFTPSGFTQVIRIPRKIVCRSGLRQEKLQKCSCTTGCSIRSDRNELVTPERLFTVLREEKKRRTLYEPGLTRTVSPRTGKEGEVRARRGRLSTSHE